MTRKINSLSSDQNGMVSLIVTMILMVVLSLIVLGFAQISRRQQRQALDNQLSTQAFYAAESGINDAINAITNNYPGYNVLGGNDSITHNKTHCGVDPSGSLNSNSVGSGSSAQYTCLLINQTPTSLVYSPVASGQSVSADVHFLTTGTPSVPATVDHMTITWGAANGSNTATALANTFPPLSSWSASIAVARLQLTNFGVAPSDYSRNVLNNSTFTAFLYPKNGGGSIGFPATPINPAVQGPIVDGSCPNTCQVTINNINSDHVFLQLSSIYAGNQSFTITAFDSAGSPLEMTGGQAVIDSTGEAQDVLRRIQVRLPLGTQPSSTHYAVQAVDGICKKLQVGTGYGVDLSHCIASP